MPISATLTPAGLHTVWVELDGVEDSPQAVRDAVEMAYGRVPASNGQLHINATTSASHTTPGTLLVKVFIGIGSRRDDVAFADWIADKVKLALDEAQVPVTVTETPGRITEPVPFREQVTQRMDAYLEAQQADKAEEPATPEPNT